MGQPKRQRSRSIAQLSVATRARRAIWRAHVPTFKEFQYGRNGTKDPVTPARSRLALRVAPAPGSGLFPNRLVLQSRLQFSSGLELSRPC